MKTLNESHVPRHLEPYLKFSMRFYDKFKADFEASILMRMDLLEEFPDEPQAESQRLSVPLNQSLLNGNLEALLRLEEMKADGYFVVCEGEYAIDWKRYWKDKRLYWRNEITDWYLLLGVAESDEQRRLIRIEIAKLEKKLNDNKTTTKKKKCKGV